MLALGALLCVMSGCVPAESNRYRGTMSRSVAPERSANADVAGAFGIRRENQPAVSLAATDD